MPKKILGLVKCVTKLNKTSPMESMGTGIWCF